MIDNTLFKKAFNLKKNNYLIKIHFYKETIPLEKWDLYQLNKNDSF